MCILVLKQVTTGVSLTMDHVIRPLYYFGFFFGNDTVAYFPIYTEQLGYTELLIKNNI